MENPNQIKAVILPKFVVNRFNLKKCPTHSNPTIHKSRVVLKDSKDNILDVKTSQELMDVLTYFRSASKVCLDLIYKHLVIENNKGDYNVGKPAKEVVLEFKDGANGVVLPLKKRKPQKRLFDNITGVKVKDLIDIDAIRSDRVEPGQKSLVIREIENRVDLTLKFGLSDISFKRKPSKFLLEVTPLEENHWEIKNEFYRNLLLKTCRENMWRKGYKAVVKWLQTPPFRLQSNINN